MSITYNFSGEEDDFVRLIRSYSTCAVLKMINQESNMLFQRKTSIPGAENTNIELFNPKTKKRVFYEITLKSWDLIDLAYYSILHSNDYRGKKSLTHNELLVLSEAVNDYKETKEELIIDSFDNQSFDILFYLFGFAGEQFKFQSLKRVLDNLTRDLYLIFESSKGICKNKDFCNIVEEEIGARWEDVCSVFLLTYTGLLKVNTINEVEKMTPFRDNEKRAIFKNVIKYYTATYDDIKDSKIGRQILYAKPFIRTQNNEIVGLGTYLTLMTYEHCILWILRNYYQKQHENRQEFVNMFGLFFEKYFEELLTNTLDEHEYSRIQESDKEKRADWRITLGSYKVLIEQKSSLVPVTVKQQETDYNAFKKYLRKTIFESVQQLRKTEEYYNDGKYIKIILLYEDYVKPEMLDYVMQMPECKIESDGFYWLVTIDEMERLLCTYKKDVSKVISIIEEKIRLETGHSKDGKALELIMSSYGVKANDYISHKRFNHYRNVWQKRIKDLCISD